MTDVLSRAQRSYCMSRIRGKDTNPERLIRTGLFALGFRYRLHRRSLAGCPDLVLPKYRAVIFVHGCFWHRHKCGLFKWPKRNAAFWRQKINRNHAGDKKNLMTLNSEGWRVLVVWECALRGRRRVNPLDLFDKIARWLASGQKQQVLELSGATRRS